MSKKVRTLLRVSSRQQLHDDDIPIQRAEVNAFIAKQPEWEFDREYIEKAVSAYKNTVADREVLLEILEDARNHQFDILLTYMSDRIGRKEEYSAYVATLNGLGIEVWTIKDGQLKTEEHVDKLLNFIRFWQNEGESVKTSKRVRDTQAELIKSGKFLGGRAPFGYQLVHSGLVSNHGRLLKKLVIVEENAQIVRKIFDWAVWQGMGYERIAKALNEEGIPAIIADKWKASTIASILKNPIYMGYPCINRRVNHGSSTRRDRRDWVYADNQMQELVIVPKEQWEQAQEIREARKARMKQAEGRLPFCTGGKLALIGLAHCGYCGKRLKNGSYCNRWTTRSGEQKEVFTARYVCPEKCRERSCYAGAYLEGAVLETVEGYLNRINGIDVRRELAEKHRKEYNCIDKEICHITKQQKAIRQDIKTLEEKIPEAIRGEYCFPAEKLAGMIADKAEELKRLECMAEQKREELRAVQKLCENHAEDILAHPDWREVFRRADAQTRRMLLSAMVDRIDVRNEEMIIRFKIRVEDFILKTNDFGTTP